MKNVILYNDFLNENKSFNDYPKKAQENARKALKWRDEHKDEVKAGTRVGWTRANQLANGENLTVDTIKRMKAFFDRHQKNKEIDSENKNEPWKDNGYVSWLLWGGDAAYNWAKNKLEELEDKNEKIIMLFENFILEYNENYFEDIEDFYEEYIYKTREIFNKIKNQEKIKFKQIPKNEYKKALDEFTKYGEFVRFPIDKIFEWKKLMLNNVIKLVILTEIQGHETHFPMDDFLDVFDDEENDYEFTKWLEEQENNSIDKNEADWGEAFEFLEEVYNIDEIIPTFSNEEHVLSDYGLKDLAELSHELIAKEKPEEIIVVINKMLDVSHQRSDLAEIFIEGGSRTLFEISN